MRDKFVIEKSRTTIIGYFENETAAVARAITQFSEDIHKVSGCNVLIRKCSNTEKNEINNCDIIIATKGVCTFFENEAVLEKWEGYIVKENEGKLYINGADKRGTIYGIYEVSSYIGVSPWYYFADVPVKKKESITIPSGYYKTDYPSVQYRGIFLNDEEELDEWAKEHTSDNTIGPQTYEKIYELLLRLKGNLIWPAMHVNYFQENPENARLADEMGVVVGTSHCDMLMRSNQNEWNPWLRKNGYKSNYEAVHSNKTDYLDNNDIEEGITHNKKEIFYDYSIEGENREEIIRYWRESVQMNHEYEVCYTIGMRGVHDYGFVTSVIDNDDTLTEEEKKEKRVRLLERIMCDQRKILTDELNEEHPSNVLQSFVPYKEVLDLYDAGLQVPDDVTLIWVDDNFGYIRRYPNEDERKRAGGHGLYYHASYWGTPDMSYLFFNTISLAHMVNELEKAYESGIRKMWVLNVGALKPIEMEMEAFIRYGWDAGKDSLIVNDIHEYTASWFANYFSLNDAHIIADYYEELCQFTNARKIEHMVSDVFTQTGYGDEAGFRLCKLRNLFEKTTDIYSNLPCEEKEAFFQLFLFKVHASYFVNAAFYYADRSVISYERGNDNAADYYSDVSQNMMQYLRSMLRYYNKIMCNGKWDKIMTPDDFPPPGISFYPAKRPSIKRRNGGLSVVTWDGNEVTESGKLKFSQYGNDEKWFELGNQRPDELSYVIHSDKDWVNVSETDGTVYTEKRVYVSIVDKLQHAGEKAVLTIECVDTKQIIILDVEVGDRIIENDYEGTLEADGSVVIYADEYNENISCENEEWKVIYGIGRGLGNVVMARGISDNDKKASLKYSFYLFSEGVFELEITRFLTLDSRGKVRFGIVVDDTESFVVESDITDEWRGDWKGAVLNNGEKMSITLPYLKKGHHTLSLYKIDNYITIHKFVIYTEKKKKSFFGPVKNVSERDWHECNNEELSKELCEIYNVSEHDIVPDLVYADSSFWNYNRIYMKNSKLPQQSAGERYYDRYYVNREVEDITELFGRGIFGQCDSHIAIDAECALEESDNAFTTSSKEEGTMWRHVRSDSYGGSGIAMQVPKNGYTWNEPLMSPGLHYKISVEEEGKYNVWIQILFEDDKSDTLYIAIDDVIVPIDEQYSKGKLFTFSTARIYFWSNICSVDISKGIHKLSIYSGDDGIQVDRIYLTTGDEIPPADVDWLRSERKE